MDRLKGNRGLTFVVVALISSIILTLLSLVITLTLIEVKASRQYADGVKALQIAESGIELAKLHISDQIEQGHNIVEYSQSKTQDDNVFEYPKSYSLIWNLEVRNEGGSDVYDITSQGIYSKSVRKISATLAIDNSQQSGRFIVCQWKQYKQE